MSPALLGAILFGSISLAAAAILLLVRDVAVAVSGRGSANATPPLRLTRMPLARDETPPRSFVGEFDQWFMRLVHETGSDWSPLVGVLFLLLFALAAGGALFVISDSPFAGLVGACLGMGVALVWLTMARARRIRLLQDQLPPALEMLARAVRAGESLEQAVELVGEKSPEPLAKEFRRVARQLDMGLAINAAMRALVYRVRLMDVRILTTTLAVHRRTGGNLAATLERLATVIRERLTYRRQMRSATAGGRASATLIATVGPLLFLYLFCFHRDYVDGLISDPMGRSMLIVAVFLEVVGLIWITRLLRTD